MQKRIKLIPPFLLIAYSVILIKLMVFRVNLLKVGALRIRVADNNIEQSNLIPFKTISSYLSGNHRWQIAFVNLVGNIVAFIPIGFLIAFIYRAMTWKKALLLAIAIGLGIETTEVIFQAGIFDIDDVILNALGVMIGYFGNRILNK